MSSSAMAVTFLAMSSLVSSLAVARMARVRVVLTRDPLPILGLTSTSCPVNANSSSSRGLHLSHGVPSTMTGSAEDVWRGAGDGKV